MSLPLAFALHLANLAQGQVARCSAKASGKLITAADGNRTNCPMPRLCTVILSEAQR